MALANTFIPYGTWWSSPFARWQGGLSGANSVELAAQTAARFLAAKDIDKDALDSLSLGFTIPQLHSFYGAPWVAGMIGCDGITGPTLSQACATSARVMASASGDLEAGVTDCTLAITCDRTSNGPQIIYPNPKGIGGMGDVEAWVWDNFNKDPNTGLAMLNTAENVAQKAGITREEQDEIALLRHEQYGRALADDRAFQKRYMFDIEIQVSKKKTITVSEDEGVFPTTAEGLAGLRPVMKDGTVTFGAQTHPADGNAGMLLCSKDKAAALSKDPGAPIQVLGFGTARVEKAHMPMAVVPAAQQALQNSGVALDQIKVIKTHNPFAVNDAYFCKQLDLGIDKLNDFGSPLIYGHPQGPTGMRVSIEMLEQLVMEGGGYGLFAGCAAGDTAMAMVVKVG